MGKTVMVRWMSAIVDKPMEDVEMAEEQPRRQLVNFAFFKVDPAWRRLPKADRERGKPGGIIACALARRAGKIAFAMVRDQAPYDPARWS